MSKNTLSVCLSPHLIQNFDLREKIVVVIDVFRATTTITSALAWGAKLVKTMNTTEESLALQTENVWCAAERNGEKVAGFSYGNSPLEYQVPEMKGKTLVLTTTNGTKCVNLSKDADFIVAGALVNLGAVCDFLKEKKQDTVLFCAGWKGKVNVEDSLFAGGVINRLKDDFEIHPHYDAGVLVEELWKNNEDNLTDLVQRASHFRRLSGKSMGADIEFCMEVDTLKNVPVFDEKEGGFVNY